MTTRTVVTMKSNEFFLLVPLYTDLIKKSVYSNSLFFVCAQRNSKDEERIWVW